MRGKLFFGLLIACLCAITAAAQRTPPANPAPVPGAGTTPATTVHLYNITEQEKERKNPVRFTDLSVELGEKLFTTQCAMCHGAEGQGNGALAKEMNVKPPDFSKADVLQKRSDGELFSIINQGSQNMPGEQKRLTEPQKWDMVNFLRSLQGKVPAKATEQEREAAQHLVTLPE
jgi:mono/diheme cytochrome c family protein